MVFPRCSDRDLAALLDSPSRHTQTMASQSTPKGVSTRLLNMKFMQRAANSPSSAPSTPTSDERTSKRRKHTHTPTAQHDIDALVNKSAVEAAIAEEERVREEALLRHAANLGDARWVLDIPEKSTMREGALQPPLDVVQVGFAQIDAPIASEEGSEPSDALSHHNSPFRRYNMDKKKASFSTWSSARV
ncbi:hypothetical protein GGR56DRAFT_626404 [Xylariaceae sp. FL0804]|nr:hypothetical protein GGR56DRAFT_626404 [Xylariaceae sp. FL0804]